MYPWFVDGVLAAALLAALVCDLRTRRIPHWITVPSLLAGFILAGAFGGLGTSWSSPGLKSSLLGAAGAYAFFAATVLLNWMGAGDANLMAALGGLLGFPAIMGATLFVALAGGVQGVFALLGRTPPGRVMARRLGFTGTDHPDFAKAVPYGVAIVLGTTVFRVWQHVMVWEQSQGR